MNTDARNSTSVGERASEYAIEGMNRDSRERAAHHPSSGSLRILSELWWERLERRCLSQPAAETLRKELERAGLSVFEYFLILDSVNAPAVTTFLGELTTSCRI